MSPDGKETRMCINDNDNHFEFNNKYVICCNSHDNWAMALTILDMWTQFSSITTKYSYVRAMVQESSTEGVGEYMIKNYEALKGEHFPPMPDEA